MMAADTLVLLSDIDGLYTANPQRDASARHFPEVAAITPEIEKMAKVRFRRVQRRMESKIAAAEDCDIRGAAVIIAAAT